MVSPNFLSYSNQRQCHLPYEAGYPFKPINFFLALHGLQKALWTQLNQPRNMQDPAQEPEGCLRQTLGWIMPALYNPPKTKSSSTWRAETCFMLLPTETHYGIKSQGIHVFASSHMRAGKALEQWKDNFSPQRPNPAICQCSPLWRFSDWPCVLAFALFIFKGRKILWHISRNHDIQA